MRTSLFILLLLATSFSPGRAFSQAYGEPDRGQPGDRMIQQYLRRETDKIHARFLDDVKSLDEWKSHRERYEQEYFHMLGLWPLPEKTPLNTTVTGHLSGDGFEVDLLHFQSRPQLYVTANLYRPAQVKAGQRLPAVLYVCGHWNCGRDGNKTAYQSHGIWLARHGYLCLILDTLQLGEIAAIHHGTIREGRWWWHSRGYTPAGVECWNGIRAIDYLISRDDVDPERIGVTGISGGGAATFWIAAADQRASVAIPVSGMADLPSYVTNRVINGHCDCIFLYNTYQWPWTRIAALIAPRPLLFVNSHDDDIFPMDANERVAARLERVYSLYGAGDMVDSLVSIGGHAYRQDIRQAAFRFLNTHLKNDPRPVTDSEEGLVAEQPPEQHPTVAREMLRVFPTDDDLPMDEQNTTIDERFVPMANVPVPADGAEFAGWQDRLKSELRRVTFGSLPERVPPAKMVRNESNETVWIETEEGIEVPLRYLPVFQSSERLGRLLLLVKSPHSKQRVPQFVHIYYQPGDELYELEPRGVGATQWTGGNWPNYVERSHALLGRTADTGRVRDVIAAARYLKAEYGGKPVCVLGEHEAGVLAAYAALWEDEISAVALASPPVTHMDNHAPQFLNVLRVCDIPDVLGMLAPRKVDLFGAADSLREKVAAIYGVAGSMEQLATHPSKSP